MSSTPRSRWRRWLVVIALTTFLLVGGAVVFLRIRFTGPALADSIEEMMNAEMRGRIRIRSIEWPTEGLSKVVTGGWIPFTLQGVDIFDACLDKEADPATCERKQLAHIEKVSLELDAHALLFGRHDLRMRSLVIDSGYLILEDVPEPYPLHYYDTTVMSLFAAFYEERKAGFFFGVAAAAPPLFEIQDFTVRNIDLTLRLGVQEEGGHALEAVCQDVQGSGFFYTDPSDPLVPKVYFSMGQGEANPIRAASAEVTVEGYHFSLSSMELRRFAQLPTDWPDDPVANNLELLLVATSKQGAEIMLDAKMLDYWDSPYGGNYLVHAEMRKAGAMAHDSIDTGMGGDKLAIDLDVTGPILYPKVHANLKDLEYSVSLVDDIEPLKLFLDELDVNLDLATETGSLDKTVGRVRQRGKDGEVSLSAKFGPGEKNAFIADAHLTISDEKPIDLALWLPPEVTKAFGSELSGTLHSHGDSEFTVQVDDLDLHLGTLHVNDGAIFAKDEFELIQLEGLKARAGDTQVHVDGEFRSTPETFALDIGLDSGDLDHWLAKFDIPAIARSAHGRHVKIGGTLDAPTASSTVALGGVPVLDDLETTFAFEGDELVIQRGVSHSVGEIRAHGSIDLSGAEPRAKKVIVTGRGVDLAKVSGMKDVVGGKADLDLVASGPLDDHIKIDATLKSDDVTLLGQKASKLRACYNHDPSDPLCEEAAALSPEDSKKCVDDAAHGGRCLIAGVQRADGGTATVVARTDAQGRLAGHVGLDELPLDVIATMAGQGELPAGGTAKLSIDLGGTMKQPTAEGTVQMLRTWVYGAFMGDESFELRVAGYGSPAEECAPGRPAPKKSSGKMAVCGTLQDGRIVVAALLGTSGTMPLEARVDLRRVEIDPFLDLGALAGTPWPLRAWTSGTITVETELAKENAPLAVNLELPEVAILVPRTDGDGRPAPLVVRNADNSPLSMSFDGKNVVLRRPVTLETPAGNITVSGQATDELLDLALVGSVDLEELAPLLGTWFDEVDGDVALDGTVTGTFAAPEVTAHLDLKSILLRPAGQDTQLEIEHARIDLSPKNGLAFNSLAIDAVDPSTGEKARLTVQGGIKLDGFTPSRWGVIVDGKLAGKMLLAFAPAELSQASGVADLNLVLQGKGERPKISGELSFNSKRPIAIMPRGLRREIVLSGGRVAFTEESISLDDISGSIDDEGSISNVNGEITLENGVPVDGDIELDADGMPFRVPRTLDLVLSARKLSIIWKPSGIELSGNVAILQGRFLQNFSFGELFLKPAESSSGPSRPFWEEYPLLGSATLKIGIEARSFSVVNNIANIEMSGHVDLTGTPRDPRLNGQISILRGTFKPQFTRARFTRTRGQVAFAFNKEFPDRTPTLDISSEADYRDTGGQEHLITLTLKGTLSDLVWDLTTSTGYNKSQTLALIVSGKAQADVARNSQDVLAGDINAIDPSTNPDSGAADQVIKDVAGDFISLLVADPLKNVGLFDVARLEVGTGSIGFHGERKVYSNANVVGDVEQTVRGRTLNVRMEIKSTFGMALQLGYLGKTYDDPAEEDVQDFETKLVYRWFIP